MCHRRQHWPKALSIVACVLMNFSTAITTDNSTSSATISSSTIFANSSTSTRSSSTSITSSSSSSSSANPQVLYSYASVTPTSTLNLSSSNANLTTPTPTESLKAVFTYPGGKSVLSLVGDYKCITSSDGSPDCWITDIYSETDSNYVQGRSGAVHAYYANPYTTLADAALAKQCGSQYSSGYSHFIATGAVHAAYTTSNDYVQPAYYEDAWKFVASEPCCLSCYLSGGNVQVYYWPTPAPTPMVTALTDDTGFVFVSPSVYVVFSSLAASDLCGPVGKTYQGKTMAFGESELSTSLGTIADPFNVINYPPETYAWTAFNYGDLTIKNCTNITASYFWDYNFNPPRSVLSITRSLAFSEQINIEPYTYTYNECSPTLSVPTELFSINKGWETCLDGISAFYDPPRILSPAVGGLTSGDSPATTANADADSRGRPTTGATATPPTPVPTVTGEPPSNQETAAKVASTSAIALAPAEPSHTNPSEEPNPSQQVPQSNIDPVQSSITIDPPAATISLNIPSKGAPAPSADPQPSNQAPARLADPQPSNQDFAPLADPQPSNQAPAPAADPQPSNQALSTPADSQPSNQAPARPADSQPSNLAPAPAADPQPSNQAPAPPVDSQLSNPGVIADKNPASSYGPQAPVDPNPTTAVAGSDPGTPTNQPPAPQNKDPPGQAESKPDTHPLSAAPVVYVSDQKITEGAPAITFGGKSVAYSAGSLHIGDSAIAVPTHSDLTGIAGGVIFSVVDPSEFPALPSPYPSALTIGHSIVTADLASQFVIGGQTLKPGAPAITVSGTPISLGPSGSHVVIAGSTVALYPSKATDPLVLTFNKQTVTANKASQFVVGSQTLSPGGPAITVSGTSIKLDSAADHVVIADSTILLSPPRPPNPTVLTVNDRTITADSASKFVVDGKTLAAGGSAITISGTPIRLAPFASALIVGSSTSAVLITGKSPAVITLGTSAYTAETFPQFVVASQTLKAGGSPIIISGTPVSLAPSASALVIGTSTLILRPPVASAAVLTFGSSVYTADVASNFVIDGKTLKPGSAITISGTPISLESHATDVIVGTVTEPVHLGALIMSGFGANPPAPTPSLVTVNGISFLADASRAIISGTTYGFGNGVAATTLVLGRASIILGPSGISGLPAYVPVTTNGLTFSIGASEAVISGTTYGFPATPSILKLSGATWTIGPHGISGLSTPTPVALGGLSFSVDASEAIIKGMTYGFPATPSILKLAGVTLTIGPQGISGLSTPTPVTLSGLTFSADASQAIIGGTTYTFGPSPTTLTVGDATITVGPSGISNLHTLTPLTVGGLTFSVDETEAVVSGTTYKIGSGAASTTVIVGTQVVRIGPGGVALPSTTIVPYSGATAGGPEGFTGAAANLAFCKAEMIWGGLLLGLIVVLAWL